MNTMDRHYLFRLSDALRRRFAFIEVPVVTPDLYAREWAILGGDGEPPAAEDHVRAFVYAVRAVYPVGTALLKAALGFVRKTAGWGVSVAEQVDQALLGSVVPILEEAPVDVLDTILHSLNADDTNRPWAAVLQAVQRLRDLADA